MNISALAKKIHSNVESRAKRSIRKDTIAVSLRRMRQKHSPNGQRSTSVIPSLFFQDCLVHTGLTELVFYKTPELLFVLQTLSRQLFKDHEFFSMVQGIHEVTLIIPSKISSQTLKDFRAFRCLSKIPHLANITLRVPPSYTTTPNIFFALLKPIAAHQINIIEISSTSSEIALLVSMDDVRKVVQLLTP